MTPESKVKKEIKDFLDFDGWFHFPIIQNFKKCSGMKGIPDRQAIKNGVVLFIEAKAPGKDLSDDQIKFKHEWILKGGHFITAYGADDIINYLKLIRMWGR